MSEEQDPSSSLLDELFSSSSEEEEENQEQLEDAEDYMNDNFLAELAKMEDAKAIAFPTQEEPSDDTLRRGFVNAPKELIKEYNTAKQQKQHKKAQFLKKQIREFGSRESMLEQAKNSLSKNLIIEEEKKTDSSQSVGLKLLKKMGYESGSGLGKAGQGMVNPVSITKQLDDLMKSRNGKVTPQIGTSEEDVQKQQEIEAFKKHMKDTGIPKKTSEEEFVKASRERHKLQKEKRKLQAMSGEAVEASVEKKVKTDDKDSEGWDEFDDF